jgi:tetratricopeptide (TPR) repeat protein
MAAFQTRKIVTYFGSRFVVASTIVLWLFTIGCGRSARYYLDHGNALFAKGQYEEASLNYQKACQRDPQMGDAFYHLALTKLKQSQLVPAYQILQRASRLLPDNEDVKVKLGDIALAAYLDSSNHPQRFYDQVTNVANQLLSKDAHSFDGIRLKANLAASDRRYEQAIDLFEQADAIRSMRPEVVIPLVQVFIATERYAESERWALKFIDHDKTYEPMYNLLYMQYMRTGRAHDAEAILKDKVSNNPSSTEARVQLAEFYRRDRRLSDMRAVLDGILAEPNHFSDGALIVGDFYAKVDDYENAFRVYTIGAKEPTKKLQYQKRIALLRIHEGKQSEGLQLINAILSEHPEDLDSHTIRGTLLIARGQQDDFNNAIQDFRQVVAARPNDAPARLNLAKALVRSQSFKDAESELTKCLKANPADETAKELLIQAHYQLRQLDAALRLADETLRLNPNNVRARFLRAVVLTDLSRFEEASKELKQILAAAPESRDAQLQLGLVYLAQKHYDAAEEIFRKLYKLGESDLRPVQGLVDVDVAQNELDKAIRLLEAEASRSPSAVMLRAVLAATELRAGKYDIALKQYQALAQEHPSTADYENGIGEVYCVRGDLVNAVTHFRRATELDPKRAASFNYLAFAQATEGDRAGAIASLRRSLELQPGDPYVLNNLAYFLAESNQNLDEALTLVQAAQKKLPGNETVVDTLGWVYLKRKQTPSAVQIFGNLVKAHPDQASYRYHHGAALLAAGDRATAQSELRAALPKIESDADRQKIKDLIGQIQ